MSAVTAALENEPLQLAPIATQAGAGTYGFAFTYTATLLLLFALLTVINIRGNGAGLFPSKLNPSMSDRPWKTRRLEEHARHHNLPKVLIMGSSRMMQVQPPYLAALTGKSVFNYAVSASGPVDWLTQLRYVLSLGIRPDLIVVGVDEFGFGGIFNRYEIQIAGHGGLFRQIPFPENIEIAKDAIGLINVESTWLSMGMIVDPPTHHQRSMRRVSNILLDDGYLIYRDKTIAKEQGVYDAANLIRHQAVKWRLALARERAPVEVLRPTPRKLELFDEFLALAAENGTEVRVVLLPLHPDYEKAALTPEMRNIRGQFSTTLEAFCAERGCIYRDFTSLKSFGGSCNEFWDGAHQTPENLRRMINVLFDLPPEKALAKVPTDLQILNHPPAISTLNTW